VCGAQFAAIGIGAVCGRFGRANPDNGGNKRGVGIANILRVGVIVGENIFRRKPGGNFKLSLAVLSIALSGLVSFKIQKRLAQWLTTWIKHDGKVMARHWRYYSPPLERLLLFLSKDQTGYCSQLKTFEPPQTTFLWPFDPR